MKIFAALRDDSQQGWVWLQLPSLPARCIVKITNPHNRKSVYCEALQIDKNFLSQYNLTPRFSITDPMSSIVIGHWYRSGLGGIETQSDVSLDVEDANSWLGRFNACTDHPQMVVRLATWLSGIGLVLGLIGLVLGVASVWPKS